ncbi:MAG: hypothetical protein ACRDPV_15360 [Gaiellaceae bacterium]
MNAIRRAAPLLVLGALLVGGHALASCGSSGDSSATTSDIYATDSTTTSQTTTTQTTPPVDKLTEVRIVVVNGAPKGGIVRETVDKGDRVVLVVKSDVADHVHLHGYDIMRDVAAGGTARIAFRAKLRGRFEVELEDRGVQIADLTVE